MIDYTETIDLLRNYSRHIAGEATAGMKTQGSIVPEYHSRANAIPSICKLCFKNFRFRAVCGRFYASLPKGAGRSSCPFGVEVEYWNVDSIGGEFGLYVIAGFRNTLDASRLAAGYPRREKKVIQGALKETSVSNGSSIDPQSTCNLFMRTVDTVFSGSVSESIRAISHQVLTPIQGAISDLGALSCSLDDRAKSKVLVDRLSGNIRSIGGLSKRISMLLVKEPDFNAQSLRKVIVHKMVHEISERLRTLAEQKRLAVNVGFNNGIIQVQAIPDQLEIVLSAIIENAVKYSFDGFENKMGTIDIGFKSYGENLEISVSSLGCYIEEVETRNDTLFQLGYRGMSSGDRRRKGTGSGLFIALKLARLHGGDIRVESRLLQGESVPKRGVSKFFVVWPAYQPDEKV